MRSTSRFHHHRFCFCCLFVVKIIKIFNKRTQHFLSFFFLCSKKELREIRHEKKRKNGFLHLFFYVKKLKINYFFLSALNGNKEQQSKKDGREKSFN